MAKYIDKEKLRKAIYNVGGENFYTLGVLSLLRDFPTADVAPVKHGTWRDTGSGQECSVCKEIQYGYDTGRLFCAHCGANMDGEEE